MSKAETEKRLIDAERFKRILQNTDRHLKGFGQHKMSELIESIIKNLDLQPTVDAVEVVRCKDCVHCFHNGEQHMKDKIISKFHSVAESMTCITLAQAIKMVEDL